MNTLFFLQKSGNVSSYLLICIPKVVDQAKGTVAALTGLAEDDSVAQGRIAARGRCPVEAAHRIWDTA